MKWSVIATYVHLLRPCLHLCSRRYIIRTVLFLWVVDELCVKVLIKEMSDIFLSTRTLFSRWLHHVKINIPAHRCTCLRTIQSILNNLFMLFYWQSSHTFKITSSITIIAVTDMTAVTYYICYYYYYYSHSYLITSMIVLPLSQHSLKWEMGLLCAHPCSNYRQWRQWQGPWWLCGLRNIIQRNAFKKLGKKRKEIQRTFFVLGNLERTFFHKE